jgi:hypothetical protein
MLEAPLVPAPRASLKVVGRIAMDTLRGRADAPSREQERLEVLLHLRVWEAVNPDARGELLP